MKPTHPIPAVSAAVAVTEPALREQALRALRTFDASMTGDFSTAASADEIVASVDRTRPDILLLGFADGAADSAELIRRVRGIPGGPKVIVIDSAAEPQTILQAMRAGATEFVYPPLEAQLADALPRVAAECAADAGQLQRNGQVLGFCSARGGCGATTLASHVAAYLQRSFRKHALLADLDFCSGNAGLLLGGGQRHHVLDAVEQIGRMDATLWRSLASSSAGMPDFIAAPAQPAELSSFTDPLTGLIRFWRTQYDYTILDLGRGLTPAACSLIPALDGIVLVTTAEMPALRQAKRAISIIQSVHPGPNRLRLVVNRMPRRAPIALPELERLMGCPIYSTLPNEYQLLADAYEESKLLNADTLLGKPLNDLAARLSGATSPEPQKARRLAFFR